MDLKRGIDKAAAAVVIELAKLSTPCTDAKSIAQVGTISANSDATIGQLIADAMERVGKEGVITVEEGSGFIDELEVVEGMQFDRGYLSPYFVTNHENMTAEQESPYTAILSIDESTRKSKTRQMGADRDVRRSSRVGDVPCVLVFRRLQDGDGATGVCRVERRSCFFCSSGKGRH